MRLLLHPDPGTGQHWRLTLELDGQGVELSGDVARRDEHEVAIAIAGRVAVALRLVAIAPDEWIAGVPL